MKTSHIRYFARLTYRKKNTRAKWSLRPNYEIREECQKKLDREYDRMKGFEDALEKFWVIEKCNLKKVRFLETVINNLYQTRDLLLIGSLRNYEHAIILDKIIDEKHDELNIYQEELKQNRSDIKHAIYVNR